MPPPRAIPVETLEALVNVVDSLRAVPRLALDTESNGMHAFRGRLCMVQLCVAETDRSASEVFLIDPLAIGNVSPLAELLGPSGPLHVIHDVAFDARLLASENLDLQNAVDTALHARYLGLRETGLGSLLAARFEVTLDKYFQHEDWSRRPLSEAHLAYLTADVAHLGPLAAGLEQEAQSLGVAEEIAVETAYALANAREGEAAVPGYSRLKGVRELTPVTRAIVRELWSEREAFARTLDVPVGRVVSNQSLLAVARARPRTVADMRRAAGLGDRSVPLATALVDAVNRGERAGDVPADEQALFVRERIGGAEIARRRARETALAAWRTAESTARGVDLQVVLPGHALADLVRLGPATIDDLSAVPGFGEVRIRRYGEAILSVIAAADAQPRS